MRLSARHWTRWTLAKNKRAYLASTFVVVASIVAGLLYSVLDPRVRLS